jgi:hypothetical protein
MTERPSIIVELRPLPEVSAPWPALRIALKALLRSHRLRARAWVSQLDLADAVADGQLVEIGVEIGLRDDGS